MSGKTHLTLGLTSSLLITHPDRLDKIVLCLGVAAIGGLISDIDVSSSKFHRYTNIALGIMAIVTFLLVIAESVWGLNIFSNNAVMRVVLGFVTFLIICAFGKEQPHRSAMHSIPALIALSACVYLIYAPVVMYFAVAMASHMIIDLLNHTNVRLLYPSKWGLSFDICHADGKVNDMLTKIFSISSVVITCFLIGWSFLDMLKLV